MFSGMKYISWTKKKKNKTTITLKANFIKKIRYFCRDAALTFCYENDVYVFACIHLHNCPLTWQNVSSYKVQGICLRFSSRQTHDYWIITECILWAGNLLSAWSVILRSKHLYCTLMSMNTRYHHYSGLRYLRLSFGSWRTSLEIWHCLPEYQWTSYKTQTVLSYQSYRLL